MGIFLLLEPLLQVGDLFLERFQLLVRIGERSALRIELVGHHLLLMGFSPLAMLILDLGRVGVHFLHLDVLLEHCWKPQVQIEAFFLLAVSIDLHLQPIVALGECLDLLSERLDDLVELDTGPLHTLGRLSGTEGLALMVGDVPPCLLQGLVQSGDLPLVIVERVELPLDHGLGTLRFDCIQPSLLKGLLSHVTTHAKAQLHLVDLILSNLLGLELQRTVNFLELLIELLDPGCELLTHGLGILLVGSPLPFVLELLLLSLVLLAELLYWLHLIDEKVKFLLLEGVGDHLDQA